MLVSKFLVHDLSKPAVAALHTSSWSQDDPPWENFSTLVKRKLNWKFISKLIHTSKKFQKQSNISNNTFLQVHVWYGRYNVTRDVEAAA